MCFLLENLKFHKMFFDLSWEISRFDKKKMFKILLRGISFWKIGGFIGANFSVGNFEVLFKEMLFFQKFRSFIETNLFFSKIRSFLNCFSISFRKTWGFIDRNVSLWKFRNLIREKCFFGEIWRFYIESNVLFFRKFQGLIRRHILLNSMFDKEKCVFGKFRSFIRENVDVEILKFE